MPLLALLCTLGHAERAQLLTKHLDKEIIPQANSTWTSVSAELLQHCTLRMLENQVSAANYINGTCTMTDQASGILTTKNGSTALTLNSQYMLDVTVGGLWPLTDEYGGQDMSGNNNSITFINVDMTDDGIEFYGDYYSWGVIPDNPSMKLGPKFSWIVHVKFSLLYFWRNSLLRFNSQSDIALEHGYLHTNIHHFTCPLLRIVHSEILTPNTWHTTVLSYDGPVGLMRMWVDGQEEQQTFTPCGDPVHSDGPAFIEIDGKLRCMALFHDALDYEEIVMFTATECGLGWLHIGPDCTFWCRF